MAGENREPIAKTWDDIMAPMQEKLQELQAANKINAIMINGFTRVLLRVWTSVSSDAGLEDPASSKERLATFIEWGKQACDEIDKKKDLAPYNRAANQRTTDQVSARAPVDEIACIREYVDLAGILKDRGIEDMREAVVKYMNAEHHRTRR